nr:flagellar hook-length control protein FliK [candidate division Zixibacteria bacterium]
MNPFLLTMNLLNTGTGQVDVTGKQPAGNPADVSGGDFMDLLLEGIQISDGEEDAIGGKGLLDILPENKKSALSGDNQETILLNDLFLKAGTTEVLLTGTWPADSQDKEQAILSLSGQDDSEQVLNDILFDRINSDVKGLVNISAEKTMPVENMINTGQEPETEVSIPGLEGLPTESLSDKASSLNSRLFSANTVVPTTGSSTRHLDIFSGLTDNSAIEEDPMVLGNSDQKTETNLKVSVSYITKQTPDMANSKMAESMTRLQNALNINEVEISDSKMKPENDGLKADSEISAGENDHQKNMKSVLSRPGMAVHITKDTKAIKSEDAGRNQSRQVEAGQSQTMEAVKPVESGDGRTGSAGPNSTHVEEKKEPDSNGIIKANNTAGELSSKNAVDLKTTSPEITHTAAADSGKSGTTADTKEITPVRFVLPDNVKSEGTNNNRTVFIKLEPEHLGTVRLTLSSHHDAICGRMVVDNSTARAAVESNLQQLFEGLSSKGIKLDSFQVSIGGGQIGQKYSPDRMSSHGRYRYDVNRQANRISTEMTSVDRSSGVGLYIGSGGVNWLA